MSQVTIDVVALVLAIVIIIAVAVCIKVSHVKRCKAKNVSNIMSMIETMNYNKLVTLAESLMIFANDMINDLENDRWGARNNVELYKANLQHIQNHFKQG